MDVVDQLEVVVIQADADVVAGDSWQGVYRFDSMVVSGTVPVESADPLRVGTQEIAGASKSGRVS